MKRHYEESRAIDASPQQIFDYLDDHTRLSSHMSKSSWRMGGGRMSIELDEARGSRIGSKIRLAGRVLGVELSVEEVVMEREPPFRKSWETVGTPRLLVVERYRMGFDIVPRAQASLVRVFIDYDLPQRGLARWCGELFGDYYARWCTRQMLSDAVARFAVAKDERVERRAPHAANDRL
jgi:hypothetical protein